MKSLWELIRLGDDTRRFEPAAPRNAGAAL